MSDERITGIDGHLTAESRHTTRLYLGEIEGDNIYFDAAMRYLTDTTRYTLPENRYFTQQYAPPPSSPQANPGVILPPSQRPFNGGDVITRLRGHEDNARQQVNALADNAAFGTETKFLFARLGFDDVNWSCSCQSAGSSDGSLVLLAEWEHHLRLGHTLTVHRDMPTIPEEGDPDA